MNEWLGVWLFSCPWWVSNKTVQMRGHYCKKEFALQGRYNCSWLAGPTPFLPWLELSPHRRISQLPFRLHFFIPVFECLVKINFTYNLDTSPVLVWRKMSLFASWLSLSTERMQHCHDACLCGPSVVFRQCFKMQENLREHDTYLSTICLRLLGFQTYCKIQKGAIVANVK